jgi:hypothetical protein
MSYILPKEKLFTESYVFEQSMTAQIKPEWDFLKKKITYIAKHFFLKCRTSLLQGWEGKVNGKFYKGQNEENGYVIRQINNPSSGCYLSYNNQEIMLFNPCDYRIVKAMPKMLTKIHLEIFKTPYQRCSTPWYYRAHMCGIILRRALKDQHEKVTNATISLPEFLTYFVGFTQPHKILTIIEALRTYFLTHRLLSVVQPQLTKKPQTVKQVFEKALNKSDKGNLIYFIKKANKLEYLEIYGVCQEIIILLQSTKEAWIRGITR